MQSSNTTIFFYNELALIILCKEDKNLISKRKLILTFVESVFSYQNISLITYVTYFEAKVWNYFEIFLEKKSTFAIFF